VVHFDCDYRYDPVAILRQRLWDIQDGLIDCSEGYREAVAETKTAIDAAENSD